MENIFFFNIDQNKKNLQTKNVTHIFATLNKISRNLIQVSIGGVEKFLDGEGLNCVLNIYIKKKWRKFRATVFHGGFFGTLGLELQKYSKKSSKQAISYPNTTFNLSMEKQLFMIMCKKGPISWIYRFSIVSNILLKRNFGDCYMYIVAVRPLTKFFWKQQSKAEVYTKTSKKKLWLYRLFRENYCNSAEKIPCPNLYDFPLYVCIVSSCVLCRIVWYELSHDKNYSVPKNPLHNIKSSKIWLK